jgi:hypothetical protein
MTRKDFKLIAETVRLLPSFETYQAVARFIQPMSSTTHLANLRIGNPFAFIWFWSMRPIR